jgi:hypothetical protein
MNQLTKAFIACGLVSVASQALDHKSCIDNSGKKDRVRFVDNKMKKFSYSLLKINTPQELIAKSNKAGVTPAGEVLIKTSATETVSLGKVTEKCLIKPKVYASL